MAMKIKLNKKQLAVIIPVTVAIIVGGIIISKKKDNEVVMEGEVMGTEVYTVPGKEKIFVNGQIVPLESKDFSVDPSKGELDVIKVEDGKRVEKGTTLFTCKNEESITELNTLKQDLAKKQGEKQTAPDEEIKKTIDSEIAELNKQISKVSATAYSSVKAPFSGIIHFNEPSENTEGASSSLMTLETEEMYIKGQASEQDLSKIDIGQEVEVLIYSTKDKLGAKITSIGKRPSSNQSGDMMGNQNMSYYDIKIGFNENQNLEKIRNGFHVQITIEASSANIKLPKSAIITEDNKTYVYKVVEGIVEKQEVTVVETTEEYAEISEGIQEESEIIRYADDESIKEGQNIYGDDQAVMEGEAQ